MGDRQRAEESKPGAVPRTCLKRVGPPGDFLDRSFPDRGDSGPGPRGRVELGHPSEFVFMLIDYPAAAAVQWLLRPMGLDLAELNLIPTMLILWCAGSVQWVAVAASGACLFRRLRAAPLRSDRTSADPR